ncbi:LPS O-antigen chain length determinant protein WzzB [Oligella urethralis]|uniref:Ferric enterobactin transport protein fepE n=1 Tax=Oligella urethralis TaxID=90245 RepID=A0A2X1UNV5_9BURK|nr:Wzz/FepE/Etk N-terminal domain-containing protein [Oligella urethralis]SPY08779.1 Ferric enterobactin transport protein fepE [Oligella urethralis]
MSEASNHKPYQMGTEQDEIDLLDLLSTLWAHKFLIILFTVLGFAAAYGLSLLQTEQWRSSAAVVAPRLVDTEGLVTEARTIQHINNPNSIKNPKEDIDINQFLINIFNNFLYTAADHDEKQSYLSKTALFQRLQKDAEPNVVLDRLSQNLSVQLPDEKNKSLATSYTLSFISDTPESAQEVLSGYIDNINQVATKTIRNDFYNDLNSKIAAAKQGKEILERAANTTRQINIEHYTNALSIAQKAGIKSVSGGLAGLNGIANSEVMLQIDLNNPELLYLQGEEILSALLEVAKNSPVIYPDEYFQLQYRIEALEALQNKEPEFQAFSYLMRPTLPPKRSSPKRAQMAVIGALVGGVLSCLVVLIMAAFRNRNKALAQN